jgi:hypothetical protein
MDPSDTAMRANQSFVKEILTMKITHVAIATAALAFGSAALAQEEVQGTEDCAALQAQFDQAAATATAEQLSTAQTARDEGKKLCDAGNTAEGSAKLKEAISQIASPTQAPRS